MASLGTAQITAGHTATVTGQDVQPNIPVSMVQLDSEKGNAVDANADPDDLKAFPDEAPDYDAQRGIQKIEATTLAWSKWSLAALLIKYAVSPTSCSKHS
jgi:hypothetical protein